MISYYKNRFIINILIFFILLIILVIFIIYPAIGEIHRINNQITEERIKLERKLDMGLNIKNIKADLENIQQSESILDMIFIKKNHELEFITELEQVAETSDVSLNINPDFSNQEEENLYVVPLQFSISGNYHSILNFIQDQESMPYYYNIDLIIISNQQTKDNKPLTSQLIGQTYLNEN